MISLQLLGGAALLGESGPVTGPAAQRRRVALLALLAASPGGSASRDKLIACFWPEEDRERARHFLADSVFMLRKHLGKESILTVGDDLVLNADVVECDARAFREAIAAGNLEKAIELYRGPFLDGFFVNDAPEFERWVETERGRLARLYGDFLEKLAKNAEAAASMDRAVELWRRLAALEPLSSRIAMRLMQALAASGDSSAALMHARVHAALLREVLDADPDPDVEALAARIALEREVGRTPPSVPSRTAPPLPMPTPVIARDANAGPADSDTVTVPVTGVAREETQPPLSPNFPDVARPVRQASRRSILAPLGLALIALMATIFWRENNGQSAESTLPAPPGDVPGIAVLPFRVLGSPDYAYWTEGVVTLMSTDLDVPGLLRPIDPYLLLSRWEEFAGGEPLTLDQGQQLARSLGAELFLLGDLVESEGNLRLVATLYRAGDSPQAVQRLDAEGADAFPLVVSLSRQILVGQLGAPADRLSQFAVRTTNSTAALKSYIAGEQSLRAADYVRAADSFRDAVAADPAFALAQYRLSMAEEWSFRFIEARQAAEKALEFARALSPRQQQLVRAWHSFITGNADEAEALYQALLNEDPTDVDAWSGLGEVLVHYNPVRGRPIEEAIHPFEEVLQHAPRYGEVRFHMLEFAARKGDPAKFDSLLAGVDQESPQRLSWEAGRAVAWGSETEKAAAMRRLAGAEEVVIGIAVARAGVHFRDMPAARELAEILTEARRPSGWRAAGHIMAAQTHLALEERDLAAGQLEAAARVAPAWGLEMQALAELVPGADPTPERLRDLRNELEAWDPDLTTPEATFFFATHAQVHNQLRLYLLALISVALGDTQQVSAYARDLGTVGRTAEGRAFARSLTRSVDAHLAKSRGEFSTALEILEQNEFSPPLERIAVSPFFAASLDRHLRAELLRDLGREAEALSWYRSLSDGPDILFWATAEARQGELAAMR